MSTKLPPIPYGSPPGSSFWNDWYEKIRLIINQTLSSFVASFNGRTGAVSLTSGDVTTALGFTPGTGTVTSVAATVPSVFSISGSPITTSGTLAITYSGTALPVVNGGTGTTTSTGTGSVVLSNSPALTGTPTAPTASVDTNTTQIATTAFVVGQAASATPIMDGTGAAGTSLRYARGDHVHPTDTSRQAAFTGLNVTITTAALTGGGTQGSMTFTNGVLTAQTPAT